MEAGRREISAFMKPHRRFRRSIYNKGKLKKRLMFPFANVNIEDSRF